MSESTHNDDIARIAGDCGTCAETTGTKRYCAPARCYCGHADCPAEWTAPSALLIDATSVPAKPVRASSWDDREKGSSWIDRL